MAMRRTYGYRFVRRSIPACKDNGRGMVQGRLLLPVITAMVAPAPQAIHSPAKVKSTASPLASADSESQPGIHHFRPLAFSTAA